MTAVITLTGALSDRPTAWHAINWYAVHRQVRRLQARMVKAVQAKRWGKVHALQHLLTHSFSGKALAVRRVTENQGKGTPGVDRVIWATDFPHQESEYPHSHRVIETNFAGVSADETAQMVAGNVIKFFHLEASVA